MMGKLRAWQRVMAPAIRCECMHMTNVTCLPGNRRLALAPTVLRNHRTTYLPHHRALIAESMWHVPHKAVVIQWFMSWPQLFPAMHICWMDSCGDLNLGDYPALAGFRKSEHQSINQSKLFITHAMSCTSLNLRRSSRQWQGANGYWKGGTWGVFWKYLVCLIPRY